MRLSATVVDSIKFSSGVTNGKVATASDGVEFLKRGTIVQRENPNYFRFHCSYLLPGNRIIGIKLSKNQTDTFLQDLDKCTHACERTSPSDRHSRNLFESKKNERESLVSFI